MKSKNHVVLNALEKDSFHIPNSFNLHHQSLDDLSLKKEKNSKIKKTIKSVVANYPKLQKLLKKDLNFEDIPIVTYCAHIVSVTHLKNY